MTHMRYAVCLLIMMGMVGLSTAQTQPISAPISITAENIHHLQSVMQIDFADYPDIRSGWFVMSPDGHYVAVRAGLNRMMIWYKTTFMTSVTVPTMVVDAVFAPPLSLTILDDSGQVIVYFLDLERQDLLTLNTTNHILQSVWFNPTTQTFWLEALTIPENEYTVFSVDFASEIQTHPYAPATDPNAMVRIGRIMPPYVVTSSPEGEVKLWHLETGEVLASADVGDMPAVFGQISPNSQWLVWRDPMSEAVNLLNFETGENQRIAELNGAYFQAFFVSDDGSVILAVDENFQPRIVAWITATGERIDLGEFRACSRVPDMIRMSQDFTTLVIGCDTGLDIWRITPESD